MKRKPVSPHLPDNYSKSRRWLAFGCLFGFIAIFLALLIDLSSKTSGGRTIATLKGFALFLILFLAIFALFQNEFVQGFWQGFWQGFEYKIKGPGSYKPRLEIETVKVLPNAGCVVAYQESQMWDNVAIVPRIIKGSAQIRWRKGLAGKWTEMQAGEIGVITGGGAEDQFIPFYLPGENPITVSGLHQFELRTRNGVDIFEIMETWSAFYLLDISC